MREIVLTILYITKVLEQHQTHPNCEENWISEKDCSCVDFSLSLTSVTAVSQWTFSFNWASIFWSSSSSCDFLVHLGGGHSKSLSSSSEEKSCAYNELRQCFVCLVCKDTVDFSALVSSCCKIILGCEECIQQWLESCPHCRKTLFLEDCMSLPIIRSLKSVLTASESSSHSSSPLIEID